MAAVIGEVVLIPPIGIYHIDFIVPTRPVPTLPRSKGNPFTAPGTMRDSYR